MRRCPGGRLDKNTQTAGVHERDTTDVGYDNIGFSLFGESRRQPRRGVGIDLTVDRQSVTDDEDSES